MATSMGRIEFRKNYAGYSQGLFIVHDEKRLPKGQEEINIGQRLSEELLPLFVDERKANRKRKKRSGKAPHLRLCSY